MHLLVYGAGAIGCHLGYCIYKAGYSVTLVCRGQHYAAVKENGVHLKICNNEILQEEYTIKEAPRFKIINNLNHLKNIPVDYIFITTKLTNYSSKELDELLPFIGEGTALIPPCTKLPFWWFYDLPSEHKAPYNNTEIDPIVSKYFIRENIIGMTMWLSAVIDKPGHVTVKHIQRGYPLGEISPRFKSKADLLREILSHSCISPKVENIRSEIFLKSINSFAFNSVALEKDFNNLQLTQDKDSLDCIWKILTEGDQILNSMNIPIIQSVEDRISQTLSSTKHTMSMLHDFKLGRTIELDFIWEGLNCVSKILGVDMSFSKSIYDRVTRKLNTNKFPIDSKSSHSSASHNEYH